ncbi:response regulator [Rugamonas apoptosis]|uniref:response regulator n=1 Tax=Rugamonas apoptosis TaxID=2758570 RepID=UPI002882DBDC|nr:response regulator [Rugamonas apoptosis]
MNLPAPAPSPPTVPALRVLLLDDDVFMLELLADMVTSLGQHTVTCETSSLRALELLRANGPDLLICDLGLPELDGIELLRMLAEQGFDGAVVLLSGLDVGVLRAAERLARAQGLALLGACAKPLARERLAALLAQAAARPRHAGVGVGTTPGMAPGVAP